MIVIGHLAGQVNPKKSPRPKAKKVLDPDKVFIAQNPNWTFENHGGQGDCAFRCAAFSIAKQQDKTLSSDALIREASRLRVLATGHLTSHKAKFEPFWAPDPDEEKLFRANLEVPTEYADYVLAASQRGYYADDLLLTALADRLNTPIIVFAWSTTRQIWERSVVSYHFEQGVATPGQKGFKPIIMMLNDHHCRSLCPFDDGENIPTAWLEQTEQKPR